MQSRTRHLRIGLITAGVAVLVAVGLWRLSESRTFQVAGTLVHRVEVADSVVALTLDDGPSVQYTDTVLALLRLHGVRATFFLVGSAMRRAPAVTRAIAAAGHEIGNHSYSHRRMLLRSGSFYRTEVEVTDSLILALGGTSPILFRPPFGVRLLGLPRYLRTTHRTTVLWDIAPDWDLGTDSAGIVNQVLAQVRPGSIILLHTMFDSRRASRQALQALLPLLLARGYRFATVSALLRLRRPRAAHGGA